MWGGIRQSFALWSCASFWSNEGGPSFNLHTQHFFFSSACLVEKFHQVKFEGNKTKLHKNERGDIYCDFSFEVLYLAWPELNWRIWMGWSSGYTPSPFQWKVLLIRWRLYLNYIYYDLGLCVSAFMCTYPVSSSHLRLNSCSHKSLFELCSFKYKKILPNYLL